MDTERRHRVNLNSDNEWLYVVVLSILGIGAYIHYHLGSVVVLSILGFLFFIFCVAFCTFLVDKSQERAVRVYESMSEHHAKALSEMVKHTPKDDNLLIADNSWQDTVVPAEFRVTEE